MHWRKWRYWRYRQKRQYRHAKKTHDKLGKVGKVEDEVCQESQKCQCKFLNNVTKIKQKQYNGLDGQLKTNKNYYGGLISQKLPKMIQKTKWNSDKNVKIVKNDNGKIETSNR